MPAFAQIAAQLEDSGVVQVDKTVARVPVASVTGEYFALLGVGPALGRVLTPADAAASAPPVVVIGHRFWRRQSRRQPVNRRHTAHCQWAEFTIVGVLAEGFGGLDLGQPVEVWRPLIAPPAAPGDRGNRSLSIVARARGDEFARRRTDAGDRRSP